jgi:hypothetical protein
MADLLELGHALPTDERRFKQVGGTSDKVGELGRERFDDDAGGLASRLRRGRQLIAGRKQRLPVRRKLARDPTRELVRLGRVCGSVATVEVIPFLLERRAARDDLGVGSPDRFRNDEPFFRVEAELLLDVGDFLVSESLTVRGTGVLLPRAEPDRRADKDERRRAGVLAGLLQRIRDGRDFARSVFLVLGSSGIDDVPARRLEPERNVFGEAVVDRAVDGDLWTRGVKKRGYKHCSFGRSLCCNHTPG